MSRPIEDYAVIGDMRTAALVSRQGSIDWLCLPRFDSAACFAALLGDAENGHWTIAPAGAVTRSRRGYAGDTLVLDTEFETSEGAVRLIDFMPRTDTHSSVVRIVEGMHGHVPMRMELAIRFDYGAAVPWVQRVDGGVVALAGPDALFLKTAVPTRGEGLTTVAEFTVGPGERVPFVLGWHPSHELPRTPPDPESSLAATKAFWRDWASHCTSEGPWRDAVIRSLLTLKALTYEPTGGIVAAATTSLPEEIGGVRNWDYRYCWLRDAALTLDALIGSGYADEALAFRDWAMRAQYYESRELDASVLLIPAVGFLPASDPRVLGTIRTIQRELTSNGLVRRYSTDQSDDGLPASEGAFLPCSFWLVDALFLAGEDREATDLFTHLLSLRNDVGLLSEEYDTSAQRLVGNFAQAFTHLQLIKSARLLTDRVAPPSATPVPVEAAGLSPWV